MTMERSSRYGFSVIELEITEKTTQWKRAMNEMEKRSRKRGATYLYDDEETNDRMTSQRLYL